MRKASLIVVVVLLAAVVALGQTLDRGEIRGTVYDPTGAVVPGAKVTLTSPSTGFTRTVESGASGLYILAQIPVGTYELTVEASGFATKTIKGVQVNVGALRTLDVSLPVKGVSQVVEVTELAAPVDTATAGVSQLINAESVSNLPLLGRDYRDLAQLTPSAQVVPGLRGGIRLGGQQSDYMGLVVDGADLYDNFFGEGFGSLETKNMTIPLDAVQEFQVVTNGFAPEFGRATGGLLNVVTKAGSNDVHGTVFYFIRGHKVSKNDALGTPPNIRMLNQFGGTIGFPIQKDKQFGYFAIERHVQDGPLVTKFARDVSGVAVPEYGISDLASLEGPHTQSTRLFSVLGRYDANIGTHHRFSERTFFTRNNTVGFTGGRGQNEIQASFGNTEAFVNEGWNTVASLNSSWGHAVNELRGTFSWQNRPRQALSSDPEVQILDTGNFGQRFFLPITGDGYKTQVIDNFEYIFGKHDMKFGGDLDAYWNKNNVFAGWSRGTYFFGTLQDFINRQPFGFIQGFGLNGQDVFQAGALDVFYQNGLGFYWQDKWAPTDRLTVTYGVRWDITLNPRTQSATPGNEVYVGVGSDSHLVTPPQQIPNDIWQLGPRVGLAYTFGEARNTVLKGSWGLYYAQAPAIFFPIGGNERGATLFCFFSACLPPGGFPTLYPSTLQANDPLFAFFGPPGITYVDPNFRNPRVSTFNISGEHTFANDWTLKASYVYVRSQRLRTGGFSSTQWERNVVVDHVDEFGRSILKPDPIFGPLRQDPTLGSAGMLGSFGHANYHEFVASLSKRFSNHFQWFANYTWSRNKDNASSERDTDTFFGPQDPFNLNLDYGISGLDITHQFKSAVVVEFPYGFTVSGLATAHSGLAYPAYIVSDINGDGISNQGFGSNDRPTVNGTSLLPRYPGRQPAFFNFDLRLQKSFKFAERYELQGLVEFFNLFNNSNLFSNPNVAAFVCDEVVATDATSPCFNRPLTAIPQPGDIGPTGTAYRSLNQISPGSSAFSTQFGVRFVF